MLQKIPGVSFVTNKVDNLKDRTNRKIQNAKNNAIRGGVVVIGLGFILWLSIFIYVVFYYTYIPPVTHSRPIFLQFKTCDDQESSMCSFPSAHIELTRRQQLLMVGQRYSVTVELELPESEANRRQGMFLVCVELAAADASLLAHGCRSTMLRYRSSFLTSLRTALYLPAFLFGSSEEKQLIHVDIFTDYVDDKGRPVTDAYVEVRSRRLQVYSARLQLSAHFSGLRHLMYHWPVVSAVVGVGTVLATWLLVLGLSWHQISQGDGIAARASRRLRDRLAAFDADEDDFEDTALIDEGKCYKDVDDSDEESIEQLTALS